MNTLFDKIWDSHVVQHVEDGPDQLYIDRLYAVNARFKTVLVKSLRVEFVNVDLSFLDDDFKPDTAYFVVRYVKILEPRVLADLVKNSVERFF